MRHVRRTIMALSLASSIITGSTIAQATPSHEATPAISTSLANDMTRIHEATEAVSGSAASYCAGKAWE